ncbi:MAG: FlgO family outer membrane protein [Desulfobulbaceae bacterium]|nr:FlgO family outer membrane protein [Desulfobulbaceae bacterium]
MNMTTCRFVKVFFVLMTAAVLLAGCSGPRRGGTVSVLSPDFFGFGDDLARQLVANRQDGRQSGERLILTTFVNLDNLYETSGFGRTLTEALSTSLFKQGFGVAEIRKAPGLFVKSDSGELTLTRDAALIARQQEAQAIIAGTYSLTPTTVIVNVRMIDAGSSDVLSVGALELQRSANINYLLAEKKGAAAGPMSAYER